MPAKKSDSATNATELSVSELSQSLKRAIEDQFGYVRLRGEVSGYRGPHTSGHCYFALKDASARIDAIIWKGVFGRLKIKPEEGMEVIASGKVTTYPGRSTYQIVIDGIEPAGVGALLAQLEERRQRLAKEGLFDDARKQLLPYLPGTIAVVTSPTGAVIRDILHRIAARFPLHVLVWPVRVQGETTGAEVAAAIEGLSALPEGGKIPRPDVIIVARGGGSLEDLWGFNDEIVVRAASESMIPLVSAVGHETDWTLIDHASDLRAPTPTAAVELTVPVRSELLAQIADLSRRHDTGQQRFLDRAQSDFRSVARALAGGDEILSLPRQRTDTAAERLRSRTQALIRDNQIHLSRVTSLLARHSPQAELVRRQERILSLGQRLTIALSTAKDKEARALTNSRQQLETAASRLKPALVRLLKNRGDRLGGIVQLFSSLNYTNVLARGFALVRDTSGTPLRSTASVSAGMGLEIQLADGRFAATADGTERSGGRQKPIVKKPNPKRASPTSGDDQGSLF